MIELVVSLQDTRAHNGINCQVESEAKHISFFLWSMIYNDRPRFLLNLSSGSTFTAGRFMQSFAVGSGRFLQDFAESCLSTSREMLGTSDSKRFLPSKQAKAKP